MFSLWVKRDRWSRGLQRDHLAAHMPGRWSDDVTPRHVSSGVLGSVSFEAPAALNASSRVFRGFCAIFLRSWV